MTLVIYNGTDGLMDKLGPWFGIIRDLVDNRTSILTRIDSAQAAYAAAEKYMTSPIDSAYRRLVNAGGDPAVRAALETCNSTLINFVDAAIPLPTRSIDDALLELERQMILQGDSVAESTVSGASAYVGTPVGDGEMVFPTLGQNVYEQVITARCVQDALTGTASGQEIFTVSTPQAVRQPFATDWARGTGITIQANPLYYLGGPSTGPSQQMLLNGSFDAFTGNAPDGWEIVAGSSIITSQAAAVQGTNSMIWTGDGSTMPELRSNMDNAVSSGLTRTTTYEVGVFVRRTVAPSGGATKVDIVGSTGVLASISIADAALTTSWALHKTSFTTTDVLPSDVYCKVYRATAALASGKDVQISCAFVSEPISFGVGRARATLAQFLILSGAEPFRNGDTIEGTISNNRGGDVQMWFDRVFGTAARGIVLPSSGSPTIPDSIIPA